MNWEWKAERVDGVEDARWTVTDGETEFQAIDEDDAKWLCDFLNTNDA